MDKIKIDIHLTISEETVKMICEKNQCDRKHLINTLIDCFEAGIASTIEDNEEFWAETTIKKN